VSLKKILILGKNSYIGTSFESYISQYKNVYEVDKISVKGNDWKYLDFSKYDVLLDVAGIAHIRITPDLEEEFYKINRDLTVELCTKAKREGVKQFIYLSSMNVYGDTSELITNSTIPEPKSFYGKSKLQADLAIQKMNTDNFKVVSIRPPVVYGSSCKGNYPLLSKISRLTPLFPNYKNTRSMIYIDNLCEFIRLVIENQERGIFHPQNKEYTSTLQIVNQVSKTYNKKVYTTGLFNPMISFFLNRIRIVNRAFANDWYSMEISNYKNFEYCIVDFKESIRQTEESEVKNNLKSI
jgi:UDP-glucose 4-epimerase